MFDRTVNIVRSVAAEFSSKLGPGEAIVRGQCPLKGPQLLQRSAVPTARPKKHYSEACSQNYERLVT
jgi:hypothetical protein